MHPLGCGRVAGVIVLARERQRGRRARIALCAHEIHDHGGMERAFAELIRQSAGQVEFVVVSSVLQEDLRALVTWKRVPTPSAPAPLRFILFWVLAGLRLSRVRPDAVHALGAITWSRADVVTVQFCHAAFAKIGTRADPDASPLRRLNINIHGALALMAERYCFRSKRVRMFAAVSPGVERELTHHYPGIPISVTPNGVDASRFRPDPTARAAVRAAHGITTEDVVAVFVGGDWRRKGLAVALEALAIAAREVPTLRLWVVGEGDQEVFRLLGSGLGVECRVSFLGRRPDVERYLQGGDIFVFPTSYETFSIASYEAAASELPVLATPVSGIEDLIGGGDAGIAVEPTSRAVAAGLVRLASDPALRRVMGTAGRQRAREFSWERSAMSVLAGYRALLSDEPSTGPGPIA